MTYVPPRFDAGKAKERGCVGKERCGERKARRRARILRDKGDAVHAYPCQFCRRWHVGASWERS